MRYETLTTVVHPDAGGHRREPLGTRIAGVLGVMAFWGLFLYCLVH